ncbi:hypothetical protein [Streptomyces prasinus]|uniref:hypothetical protein n=1 Tax=Streptomyces prasinus TaxID=67345 RepID=UPI00369CF47F
MTNPTVLALLRDAESYLSALHGSVARHDHLAANLGCAGCELRDRITAALPELAAVPVPPADQTAHRDRIADAIAGVDGGKWGTEVPKMHPFWQEVYLAYADAVLAVLPEPTPAVALTDRERAMLSFALEMAQEEIHARSLEFTDDDRTALERLRRLVDETQTGQPPVDEDPARIDRFRPEFSEHASVEAIDVQLRRARSQQRRWHLRAEWLISLRATRVAQKERGEWPAVEARQDGATP